MLSVCKRGRIDEKIYKVLTYAYDLGYQGDTGFFFTQEVQSAVKTTRSGDAWQHVHQVKTIYFSFLHENDWAGELKTEVRWKPRIGREFFREIMQGVWRNDSKARVERQVDLKDADHDPSGVLKVMRELSKENVIREDDRHSNRRVGGNPVHATGRKLDGNIASQIPHGIPPETSRMNGSEGMASVADQYGGGQYLIAPHDVCFGCARSGHYKKWRPYIEQGETAARNGDQGATVRRPLQVRHYIFS